MTRTQIVETVTADTQADLMRRLADATTGDLVELRVDGVADLDVAAAVAHAPRPAIVTCRASWEGGRWQGDEAGRRRIFAAACAAGAAFVDIERRAGWMPDVRGTATRVVVSDHDFGGVPGDLAARLSEMRRQGADVVKVAARVRTATDLLHLQAVARQSAGDVPQVVIGMGEAGYLTRLLPARFASTWTYAGSAAIAPGQMPARWLRDRFRIADVTDDTRLFGVAGAPISHSASPAMHNAALQAAGIDAVYLPVYAASAADAHALARHFGVAGLSVTAPIKRGWLDLPGVETNDDLVARLDAVNTVRIADGRMQVCNFDVPACLDGLSAAGVSCSAARALVLGAGGAARAAALGLAQSGADVTVSARRDNEAAMLADHLGVRATPWPPQGLWDIVINATSCGTWPAVDEAPVSLASLQPRVVYDLIYNPERTALLRDADARGLVTVGGLDMLVAQAARQFTWWTGVSPDAAVMRDAARQFVQETREQ